MFNASQGALFFALALRWALTLSCGFSRSSTHRAPWGVAPAKHLSAPVSTGQHLLALVCSPIHTYLNRDLRCCQLQTDFNTLQRERTYGIVNLNFNLFERGFLLCLAAQL